jgi:hypothetical protein
MSNNIFERRKRFVSAWNESLRHTQGMQAILPNPLHERKHLGELARSPRSAPEDRAAAITPSFDVLRRLAAKHPAPDEWYDEDD